MIIETENGVKLIIPGNNVFIRADSLISTGPNIQVMETQENKLLIIVDKEKSVNIDSGNDRLSYIKTSGKVLP